jgi:hypothetical protein
LPERLLEQVGRVQPLVRGQEELQAALALKGTVGRLTPSAPANALLAVPSAANNIVK